MPDQDDPFGFQDKEPGVRTVLKPMPGGRPGKTQRSPDLAQVQSPAVPPPAELAAGAVWPLSPGGGLNPVERAASALITLLGKLFRTAHHADPEALRNQVLQELRVFEANARRAGVSREDIFVAGYVLCTAIDEAVLNTPWGARSSWGRQSLLATLHKESAGGVRFFQLLQEMAKAPAANLDLLELMYICLALGFQGKYRLDEGGLVRLEQIRDQLYRTIRQQRGEIERSLSPHWEGVKQSSGALPPYIPIWVLAVGLGILLLSSYAAFSFKLNNDAAPALEKLTAIESAQLPERKLPPRVVVPPKKPPPPEPKPPQVTLATLLADDVRSGAIAIDENAYRSRVVVKGDGLFASGKVVVGSDYVGLLQRIALALDKFPGKVIVSGHTDNVPIRTLRFPSNWHLSLARAQAVMKILAAEAGPADRYEAEGRGEREPVAPNDTPANRALNRRVEITLLRHADQGSAQSE
jgi:type VI secretion system protein ImpK